MAEQIIQMLENLGRHYTLQRWNHNGKVMQIAYLEDNTFEGCQVIRWWYFDEVTDEVTQTNYRVAPNAEVDLLAVYADNFDLYHDADWCTVEWH